MLRRNARRRPTLPHPVWTPAAALMSREGQGLTASHDGLPTVVESDDRSVAPLGLGYAAAMDDASAEKVARNNVVFRAANDEIAAAAEEHGLGDGRPVPFICECSDPRCTEVISLTLAEYKRVRSNPRWFAHAGGHDSDIPDVVRLLEDHERYALAEKINHAGEVAEGLTDQADP